ARLGSRATQPSVDSIDALIFAISFASWLVFSWSRRICQYSATASSTSQAGRGAGGQACSSCLWASSKRASRIRSYAFVSGSGDVRPAALTRIAKHNTAANIDIARYRDGLERGEASPRVIM